MNHQINLFIYDEETEKIAKKNYFETLSDAYISGYKIEKSGSFTYLKRSLNPKDKVKGEMIKTHSETIRMLDEKYSHPNFFIREKVWAPDARTLSPEVYIGWVYVYNENKGIKK